MTRSARDARPEPVRLAIVGCGAAAEQCHLAGLTLAPPGVQLVALIDSVGSHAQRLNDAFNRGHASEITIATEIGRIVGRVDAAILSAPHACHAPIAIALAEAGIHCLVEKPMALSVDECDRMSEAARRSGVLLGLAFVRRLFPASRWIRAILANKTLGERIESVEWREGAAYDWPLVTPSLFVPWLAGGGVLADSGSHVLDLILWWLDADGADDIVCRDTALGGVEADSNIELRVGDVLVSIALSRLRSLPNTCTIRGTRASVEFGIDVESRFVVSDRKGRLLQRGIVPTEPPAQGEWATLFAEQLRNFGAAVRGEEKVYANDSDGRRVTKLIQACYASRAPLPAPWRAVRVL
jgi:predicted dehydrogenase